MTLLLVEDDRELAHGLSSSLAQSHYQTDIVYDGHAAIAACKHTSYELLILDLGLPDLDGLEVLRRPGRVVSKMQFIEALYDHAAQKNPAMIEVFISRLRRKLAEAQSQVSIRALRGLGYRLEAYAGP